MTTSNILPRSTPEAQGITSSSIQAFMLLRHGCVVAEGWWHPYRANTPHMLFSLSKSFASSAVGLAVNEGRLSVDDPVLKFFPEYAPKEISANLAAMQVRHLLSMSTGHDQDSTDRTMGSNDPFRAFLSQPVEHVPGTHFVYNSGATYMLSAIVQKLTGQTLVEYLTPRLFEPLGIEGAIWDSHPNGVNFGGWGLNIKTEDIARFGQLYLQKGLWHGQQLIPAAWIEAATSKQVSNAATPHNPASDWEMGYGYQFWRCQPRGIYRGDGAFGQYCIVMPEQDAVLAITSGVPDMQVVLTAVWEKLLPGMQPDPLSADPASAAALPGLLTNLKLLPPQGNTGSPKAECFSAKTIKFEPNAENIHSLSFDFKTGTLSYQLFDGDQPGTKYSFNFGAGAWVEGTSTLGAPRLQKITASGIWPAEDTFELTVCQYETPFMATITCRFTEKQVYFDYKTNVAFGRADFPQLVGKLV